MQTRKYQYKTKVFDVLKIYSRAIHQFLKQIQFVYPLLLLQINI